MRISVPARVAAVLLIALSCFAYFPLSATAVSASSADTPIPLVISGGMQTVSEKVCFSQSCTPASGYYIDSQSITLDKGYDVPELLSLNPEHIIDLKWTIKDTTSCQNLGTDPCPTSGLRYPGLDCVTSDGQPTDVCGGPGWEYGPLSWNRALDCPTVTDQFVSLKPGQSITICTSSDLFPQESASMASYLLGYDAGTIAPGAKFTAHWPISDPWNPGTGEPAPFKYKSTSCPSRDAKWTGHTPPTCADSGPFRRVYSRPGYSGAVVTVALPSVQSDVPPTLPVLPGSKEKQGKAQAGYAYLEAWDSKGGSYEFGLQYNEAANNYSIYSRGTNSAGKYYCTYDALVSAGRNIKLSVYAYPHGHSGTPQCGQVSPCKNGKPCLVEEETDLSTRKAFEVAFSEPDWNGNTLTFARVTSIAQNTDAADPGNIFNDGAIFGPIKWSAAELATVTDNVNHTKPWTKGGEQSWPDDPTRIIVLKPSGLTGETDVIYLRP